MADIFTPQERSAIMARIKGRDTKPELLVRSLLHRMGFRFRLQRKDLPGKPDIVLPKHKAVIFVHGCFWHGHAGCGRAKRPTSNTDFWNTKIDRNMKRDAEAQTALRAAGLRVLTLWQCEMKDIEVLAKQMSEFFEPGAKQKEVLSDD